MSYSHNAEADFAASELARMFAADPGLCYAADTAPAGLSANASYEVSSSPWPLADGVISLLESGTNLRRNVALEYKRANEGVHGLLTAIGQAHAYLDKGYNGVAVVVPAEYPTLADASGYVARVLDNVSQSKAVAVFGYTTPDASSPTPFAGRLLSARSMELVTSGTAAANPASSGPKTQWVHMREGSTTKDALFRFLQVAKRLSAGEPPAVPDLPGGLCDAISRLAPDKSPQEYLANTADDKFLARVWRAFWFEWVATPAVLTPWTKVGTTYETPKVFTRVERDDGGGFSQIFEGRVNGLKESLVDLLNAGAVDEAAAWEMFAAGVSAVPGRQRKQGVRDRAHSYREDLDSALAQVRWIANDGTPTDLGYRYTMICERYGGPNSAAAHDYFGATLLQTGGYEAFLHYVHRLSERRFSSDPLAYTQPTTPTSMVPRFTEASYSAYLGDLELEMTDELKVMRKVSGRARPRQRTPFQVELTLLRRYGFISNQRFRLGVGIPIEWERVIEALKIEL